MKSLFVAAAILFSLILPAFAEDVIPSTDTASVEASTDTVSVEASTDTVSVEAGSAPAVPVVPIQETTPAAPPAAVVPEKTETETEPVKEPVARPKKHGRGWGITVLTGYHSVGGDFDGNHSVVTNSGKTGMMPKIDPGLVYGASFGRTMYRRNIGIAWDVNVSGSGHTSIWATYRPLALHVEVGAGMKLFSGPDSKTSPYLSLGFYESIIMILNGSLDGTVLGDEMFSGIGMYAGCGVIRRISNRFTLTAGVNVRYTSYPDVLMMAGTTGTQVSLSSPIGILSVDPAVSLSLTF